MCYTINEYITTYKIYKYLLGSILYVFGSFWRCEMPWREYNIDNQIEIVRLHSLFEEVLSVGYDFPGEKHDFWECVYVVSGSVRASGDGQVYNVSAGEIIFHKPLEFHKLTAENGAGIFIFTFTPEGTLIDYFKNKIFRLLPEQHSIIQELIRFAQTRNKDTDLKKIQREFRYIEKFKDDKVYLQIIAAYIKLLLLSLYDNSRAVLAFDNHPDALVYKNAVSYMNNNIRTSITTAEIASYCSVSLATLKRIFDKYAGISIHQYFLKLKINAASELLKSGITVTETASQLGFSSQAYFSKAFLRETGKNPSSFKS
ncbi:MAG: helix-turn-helix domain-containing protein [Ruminococcaceae bacterium]|nr:helix-turn-helix domain-containing protein [Oscillospiraceae bacterium]